MHRGSWPETGDALVRTGRTSDEKTSILSNVTVYVPFPFVARCASRARRRVLIARRPEPGGTADLARPRPAICPREPRRVVPVDDESLERLKSSPMKLAVLFATATFSCNASNHGVPGGTLDAGDNPPVQLVFLHEPSNAGLNAVITPEIEVAALDAQGNIAPVSGRSSLRSHRTQKMRSSGARPRPCSRTAWPRSSISPSPLPARGIEIVASSPAVTASVASYLFAVFPSASTTRSTFVVDPGAATADGLMPIVAVVTALDDAGAPMPGQPVEISMTGVGADVFPSHGTTDGQGKFTTRLRSTTEGSAVATAMIGSISLTASATFTRAPCTLLFPSLPTLQHETMPVSAVTADFDGDGRVDLAIADGSSVQNLTRHG